MPFWHHRLILYPNNHHTYWASNQETHHGNRNTQQLLGHRSTQCASSSSSDSWNHSQSRSNLESTEQPWSACYSGGEWSSNGCQSERWDGDPQLNSPCMPQDPAYQPAPGECICYVWWVAQALWYYQNPKCACWSGVLVSLSNKYWRWRTARGGGSSGWGNVGGRILRCGCYNVGDKQWEGWGYCKRFPQ